MVFSFKQFSIKQNDTVMKVGTDAVLLGACINTLNAKNILDIGTGTGIIALMLAQKSNAIIDAIDIDENSFLLAKENFENSKWKNRLNAFHCSLQNYKPNKKYDLIVSNPPYFANSLKSQKEHKNKIRHNDLLSFNELIKYSSLLLEKKGSINLILPSSEENIIIKTASEYGMYCNFKISIKPKSNSKIKRIILKFELIETHFEEKELIIENADRHDLTDEYKALTKQFHPFL